MKFLHYEVNAGPQNVIEVSLSKQANVRVMDHSNFQKFKRGENISSMEEVQNKLP